MFDISFHLLHAIPKDVGDYAAHFVQPLLLLIKLTAFLFTFPLDQRVKIFFSLSQKLFFLPKFHV